MASIQTALQNATRQLSDLTLSQKLAIGMGLVMAVGAIILLGQWSATSELVPLLKQPLTTDDIAHITEGLDAAGETYKIQNNQVLVSSSANRPQLIAQLHQAGRMPADTSLGFSAMIKESNPWLSQEENNRRWVLAMKSELETVLKQFAGVRAASVFLNINSAGPRFSRNRADSTASVSLTMASGEPVSRNLGLAAARLVAGAVQGLPLHNVEVVDGNGVGVQLWDDEEGGAEGIHRRQRDMEQQIARKIRDQLNFDRHIRVNVQVEMDLTARENNATILSDPVETSRETKTDRTARNRKGAQPGVEANVGLAASATDAGGDSSTTEQTNITQQPGSTTTRESTPAGSVKSIFAAVNISRGFIESVLKRKLGDTAKLTEKQITDEFELQKTMIVSQVTMLVKPQKAQQVSVNWYYDAPEPEPPATASSVDTSMKVAGKYAAPAGLGALALIALALTLRMAKRREDGESFGLELGLPKHAIEAARKAAADLNSYRPAARGGPGGAVAGGGGGLASGGGGADLGSLMSGGTANAIPIPMSQADEGIMVAQEVDSNTAQIGRMIEQIGQAAEQDADVVATLIEKWIDGPK